MAPQVALITGANRGLGFAIARRLAGHGMHVVLAAREAAQGGRALEQLLAAGAAASTVQLDVTDPESVAAAAAAVSQDPGRLDVLVNNAGISLDDWQGPSQLPEAVWRATFETNFYGALRVTRAFLPLLLDSPAGRIVFMSSSLGSLAEIGDPSSYYYPVVAPAYQASKTALNALTVLFARELERSAIKVNAACPGWVRTDLGGPEAPRSVEQGADTPVWLATLDADGPTGGFFRDRAPIPW